jgi:hypothetical protein
VGSDGPLCILSSGRRRGARRRGGDGNRPDGSSILSPPPNEETFDISNTNIIIGPARVSPLPPRRRCHGIACAARSPFNAPCLPPTSFLPPLKALLDLCLCGL